MRNIGGRVTPAVLRSWRLLAKLGHSNPDDPPWGIRKPADRLQAMLTTSQPLPWLVTTSSAGLLGISDAPTRPTQGRAFCARARADDGIASHACDGRQRR
jgi:hypothetical protein